MRAPRGGGLYGLMAGVTFLVLALTSFSESLGQPFAFDVSEYISKPIKPRDLVAKVEEFLKKSGK